MISILIPVYNWDISNLVKETHKQCEDLSIPFEIIALDDCSTRKDLAKINREIDLPNFQLHQSKANLGNGKTRNELARLAQYEWILFLDADVSLASKSFMKTYISLIQENAQPTVYCGGLKYLEEMKSFGILRWKYGVKLEVQSPEVAQKEPYLNFKSCNFLLTKSIIKQSPFRQLKENYGFDTSFGIALESNKIPIQYIANPVYHLGLESNEVFIKKQMKFVANANWLMENDPEVAHRFRIVRVYKKLENLYLVGLIKFGFKLTKSTLLSNLKSENPSIFLFQIYKLGYLCSLRGA